MDQLNTESARLRKSVAAGTLGKGERKEKEKEQEQEQEQEQERERELEREKEKEVNGKPMVQKHMGGTDHPAGPAKYGAAMQVVRIVVFAVYFLISAMFIHGAQLLGVPLYFVNKDYFYAWVALTKQYFGLLAVQCTKWFSPTVVRISGDSSIRQQLHQLQDGRVQCDFPERLVMIANHQIYTEWLYLWWIAYTAGMHGHIYIILKESLKYVPVLGPGMMLFNFIFMSRKWATDQARMRYRLQKLNTRHSGPMTGSSDATQLDPMWLLIFPEGTNLSPNTRKRSQAYSEKSGIPDMKHTVLPRTTGLQFCLQELRNTVEYVYDCTIGYEVVPPGEYAGGIYTIRSVYLEGRPPKSVNMHWRRFKVSDIPADDVDKMQAWTLQRWREKDEIIQTFLDTGRFPADEEAAKIEEPGKIGPYIETEVRPAFPWEWLQMFVPVIAATLVGKILIKLVNSATTGRMSDD